MEFSKNIKNFVKYILSSHMFSYGAQVAFYFILALFPFLYIIIRMAALFSVSNETIHELIAYLIPSDAYDIVLFELESLSGESWQVIISGLIGLWSVSMLITSLTHAIRIGREPEKKRSFIFNKIFSLVATAIFGVCVLVSIFVILALNVATGIIMEYFNIYSRFITLLPAALMFLVNLVFVYMLVPLERIRITDALPGAVVAEILFVSGFTLFSYYVGSIADYSIVYGAMSSVVILIMWLYICSCILIFGGHINSFLLKIHTDSKKNENID